MKKFLLALTSILAVLLIFPAVTMAATSGETIVAGTITYKGTSTPVSGASVSVLCDGNTIDTTSTAGGGYSVQYPVAECTDGSTATVTASKGGPSSSNSGKVFNVPGGTVVVNVAIVDVSIVPELGLITGTGAALLGGAAFFIIRRRQLSQS